MKKLLIGVVVVVVVIVAAAVVVPFFIPVDTYKTKLIAYVKQATGRDLTIAGKVSLSLLPSVALEANDVSFSNAPGAGSKDMARFAKLEVQLKVFPLLRKEVELDKLVLIDPVIALEVDKQGRPNWQFAPSAPAAAPAPATTAAPAPAPAPAPAASGASLAELSLNDVRLENGQITYLDQRSGEKQEVTQIAMKLSLPGLDSPAKADGSAIWRNEKLALTLSLASPRALMEGKSTGVAVKLASKPVNFDFKGDAAGSTPMKLAGTVDLEVPSVRGLAQWAGSPLNAPGSGFGPLSIAGKVSMAGPKITFTEANLSLDSIKAKGEVALDSSGARPSIKGKLDVDKLDANPYLPPETASKAPEPASKPAATGNAPAAPAGTAAGGAPAAKSSDWSDAPLDLAPLKAADIDFALSAGSLIYRKIQVGKSVLGLHLKDGRFEADLTELALYQGAGKGKVVVDGSGAVPGIQSDFNLSHVQVEPLLKDAMDMDRLTGAGAIDFAVNGRGKSEREIIGALGGKCNFNLANGAIKGINLVGLVKNIGSALDTSSHSSDKTDFASLAGTCTIANGIVHQPDLALKSPELPDTTGAGTVDLPHRTVDYKITAKLVGGVAVPVIVKGPWDNLSYKPDLAGVVGDPSKLLEGGAKGVGNVLKSAPGGVGDALKSAPSGAGNVLQGILGGKK